MKPRIKNALQWFAFAAIIIISLIVAIAGVIANA